MPIELIRGVRGESSITMGFYRITGTYMRCAKIEVKYITLDVRLSKEYWKRFCDNQRNLPSPVGNFPLEIAREFKPPAKQ